MRESGVDTVLAHDDDLSAIAFAASRDILALCTIVRIDGSFSRRLGAQLAIGKDGDFAGSLADGCLERELASQAKMMGSDERRVLRFGHGSPFIDFRLPCGAGIDVLIEGNPDRRLLETVVQALHNRRLAKLPLLASGEGLLTERTYVPPLRLMLFGSGPETERLSEFCMQFGAICEVYGPESGLTLRQRPDHLVADPWTAIVLLFHDHEWEIAILEWALTTEAFLIGAIGGKGTRDNRVAALKATGFSNDEIARVKSPVGLVQHMREPRSLAVSILAEIVAEYEKLRP